MNRTGRYEIFVWTASADLNEMRDVCIQMTWDDGHSARSRISSISSMTEEDNIKAADIFVCLCRTFTEDVKRNCRFAVSYLKPVILLDFGNRDPDGLKELQRMIEGRPDGSRLKGVAEDACNLAKDYLIALHGSVRLLDGLIDTPNPSEPAYFPTRFFQRLTSRMSQWWVVHQRSHINPILKQAIADFILDQYLRLLVGAGVFKWFFESGSSIAFLSQSFAARLDDGWLRLWAEFEIETNNIFSYLEFLVAPAQRTALFPEGPPDHKYGATYGQLLSIEPPETHRELLTGRAKDLMREIRDHFKSGYQHNGIIFAAVSGIDLAGGPHVGSYPNMLFKRGILESRCPTLLLLDEDKIPNSFNPKTCYSVCDEEFSWTQVCREVPLALACAFSSKESATRVKSQLRGLGFREVGAGGRHHTPWCVISANDRFIAEITKWERAGRDNSREAATGTNAVSELVNVLVQ